MGDSLVVDGLAKVYPNGNVALEGVSLSAEAGKFMVLLGPSGSGKTTMLRILAGIERASAGTVMLGATEVCGPGLHLPPEKRNLSMVFQDYALWPHMRARDNVAYALRRRRQSRVDRRRAAESMLDRVGLSHLADRYPGELSGGEQQRVALARALIAGTGLVLCDEPLSNLDADLRERMRVEISTLIREAGATAVYITHDQAEAFALADVVGVMKGGRLVQVGAPEEVYLRPADPFVARFTGSAGELGVEILGVSARDGTVEVRAMTAGARPFSATFAGGGSPLGPNGVLLVRPGAVTVCDPLDPDRHLEGEVGDVAYRGRGYEVVIQVGPDVRLRNVSCGHRPTRGSNVGVRFDVAGSMVFGTEEAGPVGRAASRSWPPAPVGADSLHLGAG